MNKKHIILILTVLSLAFVTVNATTAVVFDIPVTTSYEQSFTGIAEKLMVTSFMGGTDGNKNISAVVTAYKNIESIKITFKAPWLINAPLQTFIIKGNALNNDGSSNKIANKIIKRDDGYYLDLKFNLKSMINNFTISDYKISQIEINYTKQPDLTITNIVKSGNYYNIVIRNIGDAIAKTNYLGALNGTKTIKNIKINSLAPGEGMAVKTAVNLRYSAFKVDNTNLVNETYKNNNMRKITKAPDLKISSTSKKSGTLYYVTVKNYGDGNAKSSYLGTYVNNKLVKKTSVSALTPNKYKKVKVVLNKKYKNSKKTFKADCTNKISESNEENNSKTVK